MENDTISIANPLTPEWVDILILLGVIVLVVLVAFGWAFAASKRRNRIHKHRHHNRRKGIREQFQKSTGDIKELVRQHRSGRQRERRPVNPALAQTGGLPPIRETDELAPPPAPQP
jgi:FtsZ-interacting cell division protein ZipA